MRVGFGAVDSVYPVDEVGYMRLGRFRQDTLGPGEVGYLIAGIKRISDTKVGDTVLDAEKTVRNVTARSLTFDEPLAGYEIHLGRTTGPDTARPSVTIDGRPDGAMSDDGKVWGTYMHGIFAADGFRGRFLESLGVTSGLADYRAGVEAALDAVAEHLERHIDVDAVLAAAR